jgi:hypothetical protein
MSFSDYSSMEKVISEAPEPKMLPARIEARVRITRVQPGISDKAGSEGARWYMPYFDSPDDPMVKEFNTFLDDPLTVDKLTDPKRAAKCLDNFNKFRQCFKLDLSKPFSWEDDLPGRVGWIIPGVQHDETYGDKNTVYSYVIGPKQQQAGSNLPPASDIPF